MTNRFNSHFYYLQCISCKKKTSEKETTSRCLSCGGPLDVIYDYDHLKLQLNFFLLKNATSKVMKYLDFYPLSERHALCSLDEGGTTLFWARRLGEKLKIKKLLIKNEGLNPTGAFKDRGSFVEINKAKELGFKSVCVASTGNMAASVSAYSAQAGLDCYVLVPENTPRGKLAQCLSYGAKVIQVSGTYNDANSLAEKTAGKYGFYLAGDYVFRAEGQKSLGFELAEKMWDEEIDWVIVPVGMGTNFSAIWKGFWEYYQMGLIKKLPRMVAVQASGCHSIFGKDNKFTIKPVGKPNTICSAIAVGNPLDGPKVIDALIRSKGVIEDAGDEETLGAQQKLAHLEALYIEPSSATTIVALDSLIKKGIVSYTDTVVCVATGAGLKDPGASLKVLADPPTVEPDISEVERVISGKLFSIRAQGMREKEKVLFDKLPSKEELKRKVLTEFTIDLTSPDLEKIYKEVRDFISNKGKNIAKADLQSILETMVSQESRRHYLELMDFQINDSKTKRARAEIEVRLNGKSYHSEGEGVGPVDAAICAIKKVIDKYDGIDFRLTDFTVEIPTTGSDATVEVTMVLKEKGGTQVVEKGTSPDIIVASMDAFVKGYNELIYQLKDPASPRMKGKNLINNASPKMKVKNLIIPHH
jgi:threonine synthase